MRPWNRVERTSAIGAGGAVDGVGGVVVSAGGGWYKYDCCRAGLGNLDDDDDDDVEAIELDE